MNPIRGSKRTILSGTKRIRRDSYFDSRTGTNWYEIIKEVRIRAGGKCEALIGGRRCGAPGKDTHHIIPLSRGGTSKLSNLLLLCDSCHKARHNHMR